MFHHIQGSWLEIGIDNLEHGFMVSTDFVPRIKKKMFVQLLPVQFVHSDKILNVNSEAMKQLMSFFNFQKNFPLLYVSGI